MLPESEDMPQTHKAYRLETMPTTQRLFAAELRSRKRNSSEKEVGYRSCKYMCGHLVLPQWPPGPFSKGLIVHRRTRHGGEGTRSELSFERQQALVGEGGGSTIEGLLGVAYLKRSLGG